MKLIANLMVCAILPAIGPAIAGTGADTRQDKGPYSLEPGVESPVLKKMKAELRRPGRWVSCKKLKLEAMSASPIVRRGNDGWYECWVTK